MMRVISARFMGTAGVRVSRTTLSYSSDCERDDIVKRTGWVEGIMGVASGIRTSVRVSGRAGQWKGEGLDEVVTSLVLVAMPVG